MNAKISFSAFCLGLLPLCSCQPVVDALADNTRAAIPFFGDDIVSGVGNVCGDMVDVCKGISAPRKNELENKKIVFLGTLQEGSQLYQIRDVLSVQHGLVVRMNDGINRLNANNKQASHKQRYALQDAFSIACYERTGGATAVFKQREDSTEGEKYTLTFASSEAGTYTYENRRNGVLIGQGDGTFDVEDLDD